GNVVNEVVRAFNGLGQMTVEYQSHNGAVDVNSTYRVSYSYSEMTNGANHSRLTAIVYPSGRVIYYDYGTGIDDAVSRVRSSYEVVNSVSQTLETDTFMGLGTLVERRFPEVGIVQSYAANPLSSDAGDDYNGLDRFGRVIDQYWYQETAD